MGAELLKALLMELPAWSTTDAFSFICNNQTLALDVRLTICPSTASLLPAVTIPVPS